MNAPTIKKIVVLSGAGMSADSGIATFRDDDGLWAKYSIEEVCTPEALRFNRDKVIDFYNMRRQEVIKAIPNAGHYALAELEKRYRVDIITQNIDNLHERAGSSHVMHLHGEIMKLRSSASDNLLVDITHAEQDKQARHPDDGALLRPHIVFFGEEVPMIQQAIPLLESADLVIVVGTSMQVYPAAGLIRYVRRHVPIYLVDTNASVGQLLPTDTHIIALPAAKGLPLLVDDLLKP